MPLTQTILSTLIIFFCCYAKQQTLLQRCSHFVLQPRQVTSKIQLISVAIIK